MQRISTLLSTTHSWVMFCWLLSICTPLYAQTYSGVFVDCRQVLNPLNGRLVCGNATFSDNSNSAGIDDFNSTAFPNNKPGCLIQKEHFSAWYAFKIEQGGTLTFTIDPISADDYDFAVFGPFANNCSNSECCKNLGNPLRCSYAADIPPGANTGLSEDAFDFSETASGDGWVKQLTVLPGQIYFLLVDNWDSSNVGFNLTWGGTAVLASSNADFLYTTDCNQVSFTNNSTPCVLTTGTLAFEWDFGDGSPITSENYVKNPKHFYPAVGTYEVTLKVKIVSEDNYNGLVTTYKKNVVITKAPPLTSFTGLNDKYCVSDVAIPVSALTGTPSGGTFELKKDGQTAWEALISFNPATLGAGTHEVRYSYQDPTDQLCKGVAIKKIQISPLPVLEIQELAAEYCADAPNVNLTATPAGGTFTVNGAAATQFNPSTLGAGTHTVKYAYTSPTTSCSNTLTRSVTVNALPALSIPNLKDSYCITSPALTLQPSPAGGTLTVNGVATAQFNPATLGIGTHTVVYSLVDSKACTNTLTRQIRIDEKPFLSFTNLQTTYCLDAPSFALTATPAGGKFKINGTETTQFNASALGAGLHTIRYDYIDPSDAGCFNTIEQQVRVNPLPQLTWLGLLDNYCVDNNTLITPRVSAIFANGNTQEYTLSGQAFVPALVGVGERQLTFTIPDPSTNCPRTITRTINIRPLPVVSITGLEPRYCQQAFAVTLRGVPSGGVFTINGNVVSQLNPALFNVGDRPVVMYTYTDGFGCRQSTSQQVEITSGNAFTPESFVLRVCPNDGAGYTLEAVSQAQEQAWRAQGKQPRYKWQPNGETTRTLLINKAEQTGEYVVEIRDSENCPLAYKEFDLTVECTPELFVPTAFSPNGDGLNDVLEFFGQDAAKLNFQVFNRWGEVVFKSDNLSTRWDGNWRGQALPAGVYVWKATYENILKVGETFQKSGRITLIR